MTQNYLVKKIFLQRKNKAVTRKIFLSCLFIIQFQFFAIAQEGYLFKFKLKPQHEYLLTVNQNTHTEIVYQGDAEFMKKLKAKGIKTPEKNDNSQFVQSKMTTTDVYNDTAFKIEIDFLRTADNDGKEMIPSGSKIFGHCELNKLPIIDSVMMSGVASRSNNNLMSVFQTAILQVDFPEVKIKIGDVFANQFPITIPQKEHEPAKVNVVTKYRLLKVSESTATFEIMQFYRMDIGKQKIPGTITGEGKGVFVYDMKSDFYKSYELNSTLVYVVKKDNSFVETISKSKLTHESKIIKK